MSAVSQSIDSKIKLSLLDQLKKHGLLEIAELDVRVRGDVAFIEGTMPNLKQKKLVGEVASKVNGIRDVVNMIRITPLPIIDDKSLIKHIKRALSRNSKVDNTNISLEAVNGVVYLGGSVSTATEKRLAELEVWAAAGVRDILNTIEVLSVKPKSEMQVVGEILQSFSECLGLDLSRVSVELKEGIAYLRGTVSNEYLKDAAEELATWTPSVAGVVNNLNVQELPGFGENTSNKLVSRTIEKLSMDT